METINIRTKISSIKKLFNNTRNTLSLDEIDQIRKRIYRKEAIYDILSKKDKLDKRERKILDRIITYFDKLHDELLKQSKYEYNPYALDLLFTDGDYYKPIEIKRAFNANYVLYESNSNENGLLYIHEYLDKIRPYLINLIDFYNTKGEWKVQLSMSIRFVSYINPDQFQLMHSKSDNVETMRGMDTDDTIQELFSSFLRRYQESLETKMKDSGYIFNRVNLLEYHFHKVSLNRGSSYIPSPDWLSHKKATISPYNNYADDRCFLYALIIALNSQSIDHHSERICKLRQFVNNYNWDNICFPAGHKDYSAFEKNNSDIAINILYVPHKTQEIRQCYISKNNKTRNIHADLLMITDGCGNWHYLAIKSIPRLLRGITSTHDGDFYCLNYFHS